MLYLAIAFISVTIFALVHLLSQKLFKLTPKAHASILSLGGGLAISYVFIDLFPKLAIGDLVVQNTLPYLARHVYVLALIGFLLFYIVDKGESILNKKESFWLSLSSYALFNFFVGYAVTDKDNPEVRPLILFTIALALHYFAIDYSLCKAHEKVYNAIGKWILIASLYFGWFLGTVVTLPAALVALVSAFIGGGVIMNVIRHELPGNTPHTMRTFIAASVLYTIILLAIG
jgi:hypothetical protein